MGTLSTTASLSEGNGAAAGSRSSAALALAREGHPVLPLHTPHETACSCGVSGCRNVGKHPRGGLGLRFATNDRETVAGWWTSWPDANVGLRCDALVVFDVDGAAGEGSLEELGDRFGRLPKTRSQRTGNGRHLLYAVPAGTPVSNSTRKLGKPAGIHLRSGSNGYIVTAPSLHASGSVYAWVDPGMPVANLPAKYLETLLRPERPPALPAFRAGASSAYGRAALRSELERLLRAGEGERNETLNLAVFRLAQLVAGGELAEHDVEQEAFLFGQLIGLSQVETRKTVRSALRAGLRWPRSRGEGGTIGGVGKSL